MEPRRPGVQVYPLDQDEVRTRLKGEAERHPRFADVQNRWALCLLAEGRTSRAAEGFQRCLDLNPRYAWARLNLAAAYALARRFQDARSILERTSQAPEGARILTEAWTTAIEGRPGNARAVLRHLPPRLLDRADVLWLRARLARGVRAGDARELAERALRAGGPSASGLAACLEGNSAEGAAFFPGLHELWLEASRHLAKQGRHEEAERACIVAQFHWGDPGPIYGHRAFLAAAEGDVSGAVRLYRLAMRLSPDDAQGPAALASHYHRRGDLELARRFFEAAIHRAPGYADLHRRLGQVEAATGRDEAALACFRRALQINPLYAAARIDEGEALLRLGRCHEGAASFRKAIQLAGPTAHLLIRLGVCQEDLGRVDEAEASYREALRLDPHAADAHYRLGFLHRQRGRHGAARAAWRSYLDMASDSADAPRVRDLMQAYDLTQFTGNRNKEFGT